MSRSYKKTPNTSIKSKWHKRQAAKKTRRSKDTLQNKQYRKQYNSWDIYDYRETGTTFNEFNKICLYTWHRSSYKARSKK